MTDYVAVAGLVCDLSGAFLLVRALTFATPESVAREWGPVSTYDNLVVFRDKARARHVVEARVAAALLVVGFVTQAVGSVGSSWSGTARIAACVLALLVGAATLSFLPPLRRRRERAAFVAMLASASDFERRAKVHAAYVAVFTQQGRDTRELEGWVEEATRRLRHRPWEELRVGAGPIIPPPSEDPGQRRE